MKMSGQLHAPAALFPWTELWYLLDKKLDVFQNRCGPYGKQKNLFTFAGIGP
jgi:hypothetical protein